MSQIPQNAEQMQQPFTPAAWVGTFPLKWSPTSKSVAGGTRNNTKNIAGNTDQSEIIGSLATIASMSGFLKSNYSNQAIFDFYNFFGSSAFVNGYDGRPVGMGFFSSDPGYPGGLGTDFGSYPIWTGVGNLTEKYFEDIESTGEYYLNYRFTLQARGVSEITILNRTTHSAGLSSFTMPAGTTGWLAGIGISGACSTNGKGNAITSINDANGITRGSCPQLGSLLLTDPVTLFPGIDTILPILGATSSVDANGGQSILLSNETAGSWIISYANSFSTVPTNVYAVIVPG